MWPPPKPHAVSSSSRLLAIAIRSFILSAGSILLVTGVAKIVSIFGVARILTANAPSLNISYSHLLVAVGIAEIIIAGVCFVPSLRSQSLLLLAAISTAFLGYRIYLWMNHWPGLCGCMGNLTGQLGIPMQTAQTMMEWILAYLLAGSYGSIFWLRAKDGLARALPLRMRTAGLGLLLLGALSIAPHAHALDYASGADVSWLPEMEANGVKFEDANGVQGDLLTIMKGMGFNAIRLRTWVNPSNDACNGNCSQAETIALAVRVKNAGMRVMIDFHYGDTWNSEGSQNPPAAWASLSYAAMQTALYNYTYNFCVALQQAGVTPEWISLGNEINSGICHPVGSISNPAQMTGLIMQGYNAVKTVFPSCNIVIHVAGPQNSSATAMLDAYQANGGKWDITGFSSYASGSDVPGVQANAASWVARYGKPIMQVEIGGPETDPGGTESTCATAIADMKSLGTNGRGTFFWEPETNICGYALNAWNSTTLQATTALVPFATAIAPLAPLVPTGLSASSGSPQVPLVWNVGASATSYNIWRSTVSGGPYTLVGASGTTSYTDAAVTNGVTYFYVVSGSNSIGQSGYSAETQATPLPFAIFVTWVGDGVSNVWSPSGNTNWNNGSGAVAYVTGYNVTFNDTGLSNPTIALSGTLLPGSVTVNGTSNYIFGGVGSLAGTMPLNKSGQGSLLLINADTYTGVTELAGGALQLANALALQDSQLDCNGGALQFSGITSASLAGLSGPSGIVLSNTSSAAVTLTVGSNNLSTTYAGGMSGSGSLSKTGTGTLTLTGSSSYTGNTNGGGGVVELPAGGAINGGPLTGNGFLVDGGTLNSLGSTNFANTNNAWLQTAGVANFTSVSEGSSDGSLFMITGGTFSAGSLTLRRTQSFTTAPTATAPIAASTTTGLYVDGASANVTLGTLTDGNLNSSTSVRVDAGTLTITGKCLVGQTTNSRWCILQVNGGALVCSDTANGIVVSQNNGTSANNAELYLSGGVTTSQKISFGASTDTVGGTSFLIVNNGSLYVGVGGIVRPNTVGLSSTISLISGLLGAQSTWSSVLPMQLNGSSFTICAGDALGNAHDIALGGALSGTGSLIKTGGGTLTLSASNSFTGATSINAGALLVNGTINGSGVTVQSGCSLGGTGAITGNVTINSGGTLATNASSFSITGNVVNNGVVRFTGGAAPKITGTFTNNGVLDIITGAQALPAIFVNHGAVLNPGIVQTKSISTSGSAVNLSIQTYTGHSYQLQKTTSLASPVWQNIGTPVTGLTGTAIMVSDPAGLAAGGGFYRILVSP
jgi:arabinogalactan endo-1,4-beta-galactosidase